MRTKVAAALGIVYVVWGSTYLAIAVADRTLPPLLMLAVRFGLAGALLYGWSRGGATCAGRVRDAASGRRRRSSAGCSCSSTRAASPGPSSGSPPGLTALLVASVPLFIAVLDRTFFGIKLSLGALSGIAAGLLGVVLLVGQSAHRRSCRCRGHPRRGVRLGRRLGLRARRAASRGAVPLRVDADALRRRVPRRHGRGDGRARRRPPGRDLGRLARRVRLSSSSSARSSPSPRTAGSCATALRASSSRPTPTSTRPWPSCSAGPSSASRRRPRDRGGSGHPRLGRDARPRAASSRRGRGADRRALEPYLRRKEAQRGELSTVPRLGDLPRVAP